MSEELPAGTIGVKSRLLWLAICVPLLVAIDQGTKAVAVSELAPLQHAPPLSYLGDTLRLQYAENKGAFGSLGSWLTDAQRFWAFSVVNGVLLTGVVIFLFSRRSIPNSLFASLLLILAGGIGNTIDRATLQYVVDFLNVGIGPVRTFIFNVADMYISLGAAILFVYWLRNPEASGRPVASQSMAANST
jgi:signal peptidase II